MVTRPHRTAVVVALALAAACIPDELTDETGLLCAPAHPCSAPWVCLDGTCQRPADAGVDAGRDAGTDAGRDGGVDGGTDAGVDAGIPFNLNLLDNPGFELIDNQAMVPLDWSTSPGVLSSATGRRSGARSARLRGDTSGSTVSLTPNRPAAGTALGMLFCARAYARSANVTRAVRVGLQIRDRPYGSGGIEPTQGSFVNLPADGGWVELTENVSSLGKGRIDIRFVTSDTLTGSETVLVDDTLLFRHPGTSCTFPP